MHPGDPIHRHGKESKGIGFAQIRLGGEGEAPQILQRSQIVGTNAVRIEAAPVARVVRVRMLQGRAQALELQRLDLAALEANTGSASGMPPSSAAVSARGRSWIAPLEIGRPLAARSRQSLVHVAQPEAEKLERQRGVEARPGQPQPVVERMLSFTWGSFTFLSCFITSEICSSVLFSSKR